VRPVVAGGSSLERTALRQLRNGMLTFRGHTKPLPPDGRERFLPGGARSSLWKIGPSAGSSQGVAAGSRWELIPSRIQPPLPCREFSAIYTHVALAITNVGLKVPVEHVPRVKRGRTR
jgi:hypothetical protein